MQVKHTYICFKLQDYKEQVVSVAKRNARKNPPFQEIMEPEVFSRFMQASSVHALPIYMERCLQDEYYEGAAVIRDLLKSRQGKREVRTDKNTYVYL